MNKKLFSLLTITALLAVAGAAYGDTITLTNPLCPDANNTNTCINSFEKLITKVSAYILGFVGVIATIVFIWAGILFIISRGDPGKIKEAQHMILYAVIGIGIALAGEALIALVTAIIGTSP